MNGPQVPRRKRFTEKWTDEGRLSERWNQQVFFITSKFPHLAAEIAAIIKRHEAEHGSPFVPSESALDELAELQLK